MPALSWACIPNSGTFSSLHDSQLPPLGPPQPLPQPPPSRPQASQGSSERVLGFSLETFLSLDLTHY